MELFDLLVGENKGIEKVDNTDLDLKMELVALLKESDQKIDEGIAEELRVWQA